MFKSPFMMKNKIKNRKTVFFSSSKADDLLIQKTVYLYVQSSLLN